MNFARLNHILIPTTAADRDRWRRSRAAWLVRPAWWLYGALSDEGRALAIVLLFVGSASVDVARTQVYVLWAVLSGLLVGALAARPLFPMPHVRLAVRAPQRVTVGQAVRLELELVNEGAARHGNVRVRRPFLPWDGAWTGQAPRVRELPPGTTVRVETAARFVQRGPHHLDVFRACQVVPFGLSVGPEVTSGQCRFVVLPRPARIHMNVSSRAAGGERAGEVHRRAVADDGDLAGVRPYRVGDRVRDLHAGTWARSGLPHVRTYEPERRLRVAVVFDTYGSARHEEAFEAAVSLAAGLVIRLARDETVVELVMVGETCTSVTVGPGSDSTGRALDALARVERATAPADGLLTGAVRSRLDDLSSLWIVGSLESERRRAGIELAARRGVPGRLLVVMPRRLARRAVRPGQHVVTAEDVRAGRAVHV